MTHVLGCGTFAWLPTASLPLSKAAVSAVAMRNALIHGYREVDNATVWQTIHEDLPALRVQIEALLAKLGEHP